MEQDSATTHERFLTLFTAMEVARYGDKSATHIAGHSAWSSRAVPGAGRAYRVAAIAGAVAVTLLLATILWVANPFADHDAPVATIVTRVDAALVYSVGDGSVHPQLRRAETYLPSCGKAAIPHRLLPDADPKQRSDRRPDSILRRRLDRRWSPPESGTFLNIGHNT
jgi:hypothetical protein